MRHFCPQVFRHQLLDAAVWQTPRQYSSQDFAAKAGTVPNDITSISAIALKAISTRMIPPMELPLGLASEQAVWNLAYVPICCLRRNENFQTGGSACSAGSSRHRTSHHGASGPLLAGMLRSPNLGNGTTLQQTAT
jgi:hypothetical protein